MGNASSLGNREDLGFDRDRLARLTRRMSSVCAAARITGASVAVVRHDQVVYRHEEGRQAFDAPDPLRPDAIFRLASMSKPITAIALMVLYEEGAWQLDDPITEWLPELGRMEVLLADGTLRRPVRPMTMRDLVTNTSGIASRVSVSGGASNVPGTAAQRRYASAGLFAGNLADLVTALGELPLASDPGTRFQYGLSQDIQGRIIEVLSGRSLDTFLRERVTDPLGLPDTGFSVAMSEVHRLVPLATFDESGEPVASRFASMPPGLFDDATVVPDYVSGGLGMYSTTSDYVRICRLLGAGGVLDGERFLSPSTVDLMRSDLLPADTPVEFADSWQGTGYGVNVAVASDPGRASYFGGALGAGSYYWGGAHGTWFWIDPVNDLSVVGMMQQEYAGFPHQGLPGPVPDLRSISRSLVYQALVAPER